MHVWIIIIIQKKQVAGYMSPEVLFSKNHSFSVDFYALGIISYELMLGYRQYQSITRIELREEILKKQALIKYINLKKRKFNRFWH